MTDVLKTLITCHTITAAESLAWPSKSSNRFVCVLVVAVPDALVAFDFFVAFTDILALVSPSIECLTSRCKYDYEECQHKGTGAPSPLPLTLSFRIVCSIF